MRHSEKLGWFVRLLLAVIASLAGRWLIASPPPLPGKEASPPAKTDVVEVPVPAIVREFDQAGLKVRVDRSKQVLLVESPKTESYLREEVTGNQAVEVVRDGAELRQGDKSLAILLKGRKLYVTAVQGDWAGVTLQSNGQALAGWLQRANIRPLPSEPRAYRYLRNAASNARFVSAAILMQKAKQFDDGLYAAVELAAQNGLGDMPAKAKLLQNWAAEVPPADTGSSFTALLAAGERGGLDILIPRGQEPLVQKLLARGDHKPLGFYTWSPELSAIYRQDKTLQFGAKNASDCEGLVTALVGNMDLRSAYLKHLDLAYRMTNPPRGTSSDLRPLLPNRPRPPLVVTGWHILPPSTSHETELFLRLFGTANSVPDEFSLMDRLITEIRADRIRLEPRQDSGWYDHQTWSLQPLLLPEKMPEASHLACGQEYRKNLENLFKGTLALARETHVKQLSMPRAAAAPPPPFKERPKLVIAPDLIVEPLPTMYLRRARTYVFVRQVLAEAFGEKALSQMHRQTAEGPVRPTLAEELAEITALFYGAHYVASRQLGRPEDAVSLTGAGEGMGSNPAKFLDWAFQAADDLDLARDIRMMVPVFHDPANGRIKVWCVLGWTRQAAWASFQRQPEISATSDGMPVEVDKYFEVLYTGESLELAQPVFAETWVTKLLNRDEFRQHCDTYVMPAVILANLE